MPNSKNINATQGKLRQSLGVFVEGVVASQGFDEKINKAVDTVKIRTGVVTKFYHYLDKAEVQLDNSNDKVLCKILHRFGGELIEYFTPLADEIVFCNVRKEPCIKPRAELHCLVVNIHDADSNEWLLLGFYENEELVGVNPAKPGNIKITTRGAVNQYWVKFGYDGLDLRLPDDVSKNVGEYDRDMKEIIPMSPNDYYAKIEIDELLKTYEDRIKVLEDTLAEQGLTQPESGATGTPATDEGTDDGA